MLVSTMSKVKGSSSEPGPAPGQFSTEPGQFSTGQGSEVEDHGT